MLIFYLLEKFTLKTYFYRFRPNWKQAPKIKKILEKFKKNLEYKNTYSQLKSFSWYNSFQNKSDKEKEVI